MLMNTTPVEHSQKKSASRIRMLLIDDDEDAYVLTESLLSDFIERKYTLEWVSSFEAGLEAMGQDNHDIYLVDYMLDRHTGLELISEARRRGNEKPIVFMTALESHEIDVFAMEAGASDYLVKGDITPRVLERSIRYALRHQRVLNDLKLSAEELQHLNGQLSASEAELTEMNKTKDKFFSIISHNLKTPFTSLLGFSELLACCIDELSNEQVREASQRIYQSGKNVYRLLDNLLQWSRLQAGRMVCTPVPVQVREMVERVFVLYRDMADQKHVTLRNATGECDSVIADSTMLQSVIENLVSNALKFTPSGGSIEVASALDDSGMHISVTDTGVGMDESDISKLFVLDGHHSTLGTDSEEGTGLGLIICHELIRRHHGDIQVASVRGCGATFTIHLPESQPHGHTCEAGSAAPGKALGSNLTGTTSDRQSRPFHER
jgi:signal transduction histidine kinase